MESTSLSVEQGGREMTEQSSQDPYTSTGRSNSSWKHVDEERPPASAEEEILQHLERRITEENKEGLDVSMGCSESLWDDSKVHHRSRQHEDHTCAPEGKRRKKVGKKIVVGMKLTTECREVLTWTIAKLAHPGDHVVALHVSSFSSQSGTLSATPLCLPLFLSTVCDNHPLSLSFTLMVGFLKFSLGILPLSRSRD